MNAQQLAVTLVTVVASLVLTTTPRRWVVVAGALFLLVLPGVPGVLNVGVGTIFVLTGVPAMSRHAKGLRTGWLTCVWLIAAWYAIVSFWSPEQMTAVRTAVGTASLACYLGIAVGYHRADDRVVPAMLKFMSPVVVVQAASTFYFTHNHGLKERYYSSEVSHWLFGDVAADAVQGIGKINALSADKSAGFLFVNGNRASMVMGVMGLCYAAYALRDRKRWAWLVALVSFAGVFGSQSKTGIVLLVVLPVVGFILATVGARFDGIGRLGALPLALVLAVVGVVATTRLAGVFVGRLDEAMGPRKELWDAAWDMSTGNPLTGVGVGGWEDEWPLIAPGVGGNPDLPPHNFLLYAGTQGGLVMLVLQALFTVFAVRFVLGRLTFVPTRRLRLGQAFCAMAFAWAFLHGMGDNTTFYGVSNSAPFAALAFMLASSIRATSTAVDVVPALEAAPAKQLTA